MHLWMYEPTVCEQIYFFELDRELVLLCEPVLVFEPVLERPMSTTPVRWYSGTLLVLAASRSWRSISLYTFKVSQWSFDAKEE